MNLATAGGGCAAIYGGSPENCRDSKRLSKSSYDVYNPLPNYLKVTIDFSIQFSELH
jgi:hypothetical protein